MPDSDPDWYNATVDGSDLVFLDPNEDKNNGQDILNLLDLCIFITDPTFTPDRDANLFAIFLDPSMLLSSVDNISTLLTE